MQTAAAPITTRRSWYGLTAAAIFLLAIALLVIGIGKEFRLKHESNGILYWRIARSHLDLGLGVTHGHDLLVSPSGELGFYAHHPPGIGLILAAAISVSGRDGPLLIRSLAISFHLLSLLLLCLLLYRLHGPWQALAGGLLFAVLPQAAFFGRMYNHEPIALPALILLVTCYHDYLEGGGRRWLIGMVLAATWGAVIAWLTFFVLASCAVHAGAAWWAGRQRAATALLTLVLAAAGLFFLDLAHLGWVLDWDLSSLLALLTDRAGVGSGTSPLRWLLHQTDIHRRYFTLFGLVAVTVLALRLGKGLARLLRRQPSLLEPSEELAGIFLFAGTAYLLVFNVNAEQHHYWQFILLPADVIAMILLLRRLWHWTRDAAARPRWRSLARRALLALIAIEIVVSSAVTLVKRHTKPDAFTLKAVERHRPAASCS